MTVTKKGLEERRRLLDAICDALQSGEALVWSDLEYQRAKLVLGEVGIVLFPEEELRTLGHAVQPKQKPVALVNGGDGHGVTVLRLYVYGVQTVANRKGK